MSAERANPEGPASYGESEKHHDVKHKIFVNGVEHHWHEKKISHEQVVHLAFPRGTAGHDIRYTVTWTKPDGQEGALRPGHTVHVVQEMMFDVRNTDKS